MARLMTATMWDSIDWLHNAPSSIKRGTNITWKEDAYNQLLNTLNRVWSPTKAITRGINYEKALCHGKKPEVAQDLIEKFNKAWDMIHVKGGEFQGKVKQFVDYDDKEFLLYGKMDVLFDSTTKQAKDVEMKPMMYNSKTFARLIMDIKTTGNYNGQDNYLKKWQHKVYCHVTKIPDFVFIVYIFDNDTGMVVDIKFIDYHVDDFKALEKEVMDKLESVIKFLRADPKLKDAYLHKFCY